MSDENRPWLKGKNFGDGMPQLLTLIEAGDGAPWFWSDPSKTFKTGSKVDRCPCWLFSITMNETAYTMDGNLKMTRAIAAMEQKTGSMGDGSTFTLEKTIVGKRHDWIAIMTSNPNPPNRHAVSPTDIFFVEDGGGGDQQSQSGTQGAPQGSPAPQGTPGGTTGSPGVAPPSTNGGNGGYVSIRDAYRAPWSKLQARALWDFAAAAAQEHIVALFFDKTMGEAEVKLENVGDPVGAYQGLVATYVIHGQRAMHPQSFGDEGPMPESIIDRFHGELIRLATDAELDLDSVNTVIANTYLSSGKKFGAILKRAVDNWSSFHALVLEQMEAEGKLPEEPDEPDDEEGPADAGVTEDDIPF